MATFTNAFDSFQVFYYGVGTTPPPPPPPPLSPGTTVAAVIQCYQGGVFAGRMVFYPTDPLSVPKNSTIAPLGTQVPSLNYALSSFEHVFAILRHTKPLYLFFDNGSGVGMLATSQAIPVGV